jgi:L-fucose isomerase-like protein
VETPREGEAYANFLAKNRGKYDGVILCLPNFGDETGAVAALREAGVPIFVHAYPDELDRMGPKDRRDAFCGKFSVMDVFCQYGIPFTALQPHVVHPKSDTFAANMDHFDKVCRIVKNLRNMTVGAIGARTTAFKTVRIDELALQKHGITMETVDMSDVFARMRALNTMEKKYRKAEKRLANYGTWEGVPKQSFENLVRMSVALDNVIEEMQLDAVAIRCWLELQKEWNVSCCVLLSEMNDRGMAAACEVDVGSAITMHALSSASGSVSACLDWNNNYGEEPDKCILFHCGSTARSMMKGKGEVVDHAILVEALGKNKSCGCYVGRIAPGEFTFGNLLTVDGRLEFYLGEGRFTEDPIPKEFFGCAGVAEIENLQDVLQTIGYAGHRHHVATTLGHHAAPIREAFERYLGYGVMAV